MLEIMQCVFGSHMYGLNTANSDTDYKAIYLPTKRELLLGTYKRQISSTTGDDKSKNNKDDVDMEIFSLPYFIELACQGQTVAIDMLHARETRITHPIWEELVKQRHLFYTRNMSSYIGYARKQANKYGIKGSRIAALEQLINTLAKIHADVFYNCTIEKIQDQLPLNEYLFWETQENRWDKSKQMSFYNVCGRKYMLSMRLETLMERVVSILDEYGVRAKEAKENKNVDWKAVSHALRAAYQMREVLLSGDFTYPLKETEFLLQVKTGTLDFVSQVQPELDGAIKQIEELCKTSSLPEKVNRDYWDDWLLKVYDNYL